MYSTTMPFYHIRVTEHAQYAIEAKNFSALQVFLSAIMIILSVTNALLGSVQSSGEVLTQLICSMSKHFAQCMPKQSVACKISAHITVCVKASNKVYIFTYPWRNVLLVGYDCSVNFVSQASHQYWMSHEFYYACALLFLFSVSHIVVVSNYLVNSFFLLSRLLQFINLFFSGMLAKKVFKRTNLYD